MNVRFRSKIEAFRKWLQEFPLNDDDFRTRKGVSSGAHSKVIRGIDSEWKASRGFGQSSGYGITEIHPEGGPGLDFVVRRSHSGEILLAMEVDNDWNEESLKKLADTRAMVKVRVIIGEVPKDEDNAKEWADWFNWFKEEASHFMNAYGSVKSGEILLICRTPAFLWEASVP